MVRDFHAYLLSSLFRANKNYSQVNRINDFSLNFVHQILHNEKVEFSFDALSRFWQRPLRVLDILISPTLS